VYGHPHPDTLGRIAAVGAQVRRTDLNGETQYRIAGGALSVRTAAGGQLENHS
jgi:competence protein ComEC